MMSERLTTLLDCWSTAFQNRQLIPGSLIASPAAHLIARHNFFELVKVKRDWEWAEPHKEKAYHYWSVCSAAARGETYSVAPEPWLLAPGYSMAILGKTDNAFDDYRHCTDLNAAYFEGMFDPDMTRARLHSALSVLLDYLRISGEEANQAYARITHFS